MSDCALCGGSGGGPDPALRCPRCGGDGRDPGSARRALEEQAEARAEAEIDRRQCDEWEDIL